METPSGEAPRETLDRLHIEAAELRASRRRLVLAADADRRQIERDLHQRVDQHFIALAVDLQLLGQAADASPAAQAIVDEMGRHLQQALDATAQLAQRIYPPMLTERGLGVALRAAAVTAGIPVSVDVATRGTCAPEVARTVYLCCLEAMVQAGAGARPTVTVRDENRVLTFEVSCDRALADDSGLERLRERVEALGGRLTVGSEPNGGTRVSGLLPVDS